MSSPTPSTCLYTVTVPLPLDAVGMVDGHSHVWIDPAGSVDPDAPVLNTLSDITAGLQSFRAAGGSTLIDCQPGGCGRNALMLRRLSLETGVSILAATGFHRRRYYPPSTTLFDASEDVACAYFIGELTQGLEETRDAAEPVRSGFIKIACEATLEDTPLNLMRAAVLAAVETGAGIEVHTERGAAAEVIADFMLKAGLPAHRLILCHMDKRPDIALHRSLAQQGIALEYDTFFRPKYQSDTYLWPLLEQMIGDGLDESIVVATDMADPQMWREATGPEGASLPARIVPRMAEMGFPDQTIRKLTGLNVAQRLARTYEEAAP